MQLRFHSAHILYIHYTACYRAIFVIFSSCFVNAMLSDSGIAPDGSRLQETTLLPPVQTLNSDKIRARRVFNFPTRILLRPLRTKHILLVVVTSWLILDSLLAEVVLAHLDELLRHQRMESTRIVCILFVERCSCHSEDMKVNH